MNHTNTGGPAFPYYHPDLGGAAGMTLRDYFAAKAMNAFLSRDGGTLEMDAKAAYKMADAMLKARES
jgi:hypothetical protein